MKPLKSSRHTMVAMPAGRTSTLKKARRTMRVIEGQRPSHVKFVKMADGGVWGIPANLAARNATHVLHPTKGWRRA